MFVIGTLLAVVTVPALLCAVLLAVHCHEASRRARSHLGSLPEKPGGNDLPPATLIAPVKGSDLDMEANLAALLALDYPEYEILFVVEAENDPASPVIDRLIANSRVPARRIVAGLAESCGQKVHNLRVAVAGMSRRTEAIAFVDADARPDSNWLRMMISGLRYRKVAAVTGYRWMVPQRPTLANLVGSSMNASCAGMLGRHNHNLVWGGSWAIMRSTFNEIELPRHWNHSLSDDLTAGRILRERGTPADFEPGALCASVIDFNWAEFLEFARRQFMIGRCYASTHWRLGLLAALLLQFGMWGNAIASGIMWLGGNSLWLVPAVAATALYGIGCYRAWCRQTTARAALPGHVGPGHASYWFDLLAGPAVGLLTLAIILSSSVGKRLTWRGITYELDARGKVLSIARDVLPLPAQTGATVAADSRRAA